MKSRHTIAGSFRSLCLLALALSPAVARSEAPYLLTASNCVVVLPTRRVADSSRHVVWSPDSKRMLAFNIAYHDAGLAGEKQIAADMSIVRWNRTTGVSSSIWQNRFASEPTFIGRPTWIPNSPACVSQIAWVEIEKDSHADAASAPRAVMRQAILWIDASASSVRLIPLEEGDQFTVSPTGFRAAIIKGPFNKAAKSIIPLRIDGSMGTRIDLPDALVPTGINWSADGKQLVASLVQSAPNNKQLVADYTVDFERRAVVAGKPALYKAKQKSVDLVVMRRTSRIKNGDVEQAINSIWLQSTTPSQRPNALICADGDEAIVSPDGGAVAYLSQGCSWVAPLMTLNLDQYKKDLADGLRVSTMNRGKQVGLAGIMYAMDHDNVLPGIDNISDMLEPYLKDQTAVDGLNWTFPGGSITGIKDPANTELGYVDGVAGRAVIFADGHVMWRNQ